jgi:hypothetical protein
LGLHRRAGDGDKHGTTHGRERSGASAPGARAELTTASCG